MPAEDQRRMRLLHRLGIGPEAFDADGLAVIDGSVIAPQFLQQPDVFARARRAILEVHSDRLELLLEPSDSDTENEAPATEHVQARDRLCGRERVSDRQHVYSGGKAYLAGD